MKATLNSSVNSTRHNFNVEHGGFTYNVVIWTDEKGKFMDEEISLNDEELEGEGEEGTIREEIIGYLDKNWDNLVK